VRGRKALGHGGGIFGFSTDSIYLPEQDVFVAVFANSDEPMTDPGMLLMQLAALAIDDPFPTFTKAALDVKTVEPWVGVYRLDQGERRLYVRDGKLFTQRSGASEREVYRSADGRYFYPDSLTYFELVRGADGIPVIAMHQEGSATPERSSRSGPIPPEPKAIEVPRATLQSYVGTYTAPIGPVAIALPATGAMTVQLPGQQPIALTALSVTEFRPVGVDARLVFTLEAGNVAGLVIHQGGRELPAKKD
jgi:hypothetical protein